MSAICLCSNCNRRVCNFFSGSPKIDIPIEKLFKGLPIIRQRVQWFINSGNRGPCEDLIFRQQNGWSGTEKIKREQEHERCEPTHYATFLLGIRINPFFCFWVVFEFFFVHVMTKPYRGIRFMAMGRELVRDTVERVPTGGPS